MEKLNYEPNVIASALASKKGWKIAVLMPDPTNDPFWLQPKRGIERAKKALRDYGVSIDFYFFKDDDPSNFKRKGNQILSKHYDAMLLSPSFSKEGHAFLTRCEEKGLKYIEINTFLNRNHPCCLAYIGQDSYSTGTLAAKLLNFEMKEGDTALILHLEKEVYNAKHLIDKQSGFEDYFSSHPQKAINIIKKSFGEVLNKRKLEEFIKKTLS